MRFVILFFLIVFASDKTIAQQKELGAFFDLDYLLYRPYSRGNYVNTRYNFNFNFGWNFSEKNTLGLGFGYYSSKVEETGYYLGSYGSRDLYMLMYPYYERQLFFKGRMKVNLRSEVDFMSSMFGKFLNLKISPWAIVQLNERHHLTASVLSLNALFELPTRYNDYYFEHVSNRINHNSFLLGYQFILKGKNEE